MRSKPFPIGRLRIPHGLFIYRNVRCRSSACAEKPMTECGREWAHERPSVTTLGFDRRISFRGAADRLAAGLNAGQSLTPSA